MPERDTPPRGMIRDIINCFLSEKVARKQIAADREPLLARLAGRAGGYQASSERKTGT